MKQLNNYKARDISFAIILVVIMALFIYFFTSCTKYEQVILPYYDTTFVVITDSNRVSVLDTTYVVITDTNYINIFDTTRIIVNDTIYITILIYDTVSTIQVGNQLWMKGDLQVTTYNDGTSIKFAEGNVDWSQAESAYCYYLNDPNSYILYNWYAVASEKLCPSGFHVPTETDWIILEEYLGDDSRRGGKLKEQGYTHWMRPNAEATDDFGWTAVPKGARWYNGEWILNNPSDVFAIQSVQWWSSSIDPTASLPIYREVFYNMGSLGKYRHSANMGFSVRCLKNN